MATIQWSNSPIFFSSIYELRALFDLGLIVSLVPTNWAPFCLLFAIQMAHLRHWWYFQKLFLTVANQLFLFVFFLLLPPRITSLLVVERVRTGWIIGAICVKTEIFFVEHLHDFFERMDE